MTMPYERFRAINNTREWLLVNLTNTKLPKYIREEMRSLLRHYPVHSELAHIAEQAPHYLEATPDPFVKIINEYPGVDTEDDS